MAKTKALISCAVTAQLRCVFVFAYANRWFFHAESHLQILDQTSFVIRFFQVIDVIRNIRIDFRQNTFDRRNLVLRCLTESESVDIV